MAKNNTGMSAAVALIGAGVAAIAFSAMKKGGEEPPVDVPPGGDPARPESHTISKLEVAYAVPE